jgi:hypothetical protein
VSQTDGKPLAELNEVAGDPGAFAARLRAFAESRGTGIAYANHEPRLGVRRVAVSKTVRETEAEVVAFVVSDAIGLHTSTAASDYIQLYSGSKDTLLASLEAIRHTAVQILDAIQETGDSAPSRRFGVPDAANYQPAPVA